MTVVTELCPYHCRLFWMDKVPSVSGLTLKMFLLKRWVHINGKVRIIEDDQLLHMYVQLLCTYVCTTLHSTYSIILPSMYRAVTVSLLLQALKLLHPTNCLQWYPVSTVVNSIKHKSPECMKKIDPECVPLTPLREWCTSPDIHVHHLAAHLVFVV